MGSEPSYGYICPACRFVVIRRRVIGVAWAAFLHRLESHDDPWSVFTI